MLNLEKIKTAKTRLEGVAVNTPFSYATYLSAHSGAEVYIKKENLQNTGSFKLRGAFNKIASLSEAERAKGVVAASAGNHAQGVAFSAKHFNIDAVIVMPESTPLTKVEGVTRFGAKAVLHGENYDEAYAKAIEIQKAEDKTFIHPFVDTDVMAGQGTIALEMLEVVDDLDVIVVPIGGGGLIGGVSMAIKTLRPDIKVVGVSAKGASSFHDSFWAKGNVGAKNVRTIADGIAVRETQNETLDIALEHVDEVVSVDEEEIAAAILFLLEKQKLLVEGAGAVGVAALMHDKIVNVANKKVGIVLSGGNIDVTMLNIIIEKGLVKSFRKMKLQIILVDKPGSLMHLTNILQESNANIVQISYDRNSTELAFGDALVGFDVETKGREHQALIAQKLTEHGYQFKVLS